MKWIGRNDDIVENDRLIRTLNHKEKVKSIACIFFSEFGEYQPLTQYPTSVSLFELEQKKAMKSINRMHLHPLTAQTAQTSRCFRNC